MNFPRGEEGHNEDTHQQQADNGKGDSAEGCWANLACSNESTQCGADQNADADEGFVESGMSAVAIGDVHGVVEGTGVEQRGRESKKYLRDDQHHRVVEEEHNEEGQRQRDLSGQQPGRFVVPAGPLPGDEKAGDARESPDGGDDADGGEAGEAGLFGEGVFDGDEDVDGDVGKGVADPGHEQEAFGAGALLRGIEILFAGNFVGNVVLADERLRRSELIKKAKCDEGTESGDEKNGGPAHFFESAAGEKRDEAGGAPGEVVEGGAGAEGCAGAGAGDGTFQRGPHGGTGDVEGEQDGKEQGDGGEGDADEAEEAGENGAEDSNPHEAAGPESFGETSSVEADEDVGKAPGGAEEEGNAGRGAEGFVGVVVQAGGEERGAIGVEKLNEVPRGKYPGIGETVRR